MSEIIATSQWIKFFTNAGLPPNVAANYAIIFSDNRIQINMLMDLSKEYLFDMGIRTMGDVIAILRYAKEFHSQLAKDKVMGKIAVNTSKKAVERMLGHYARPLPVAVAPTRPIPQLPQQKAIPQQKTIPQQVRAQKNSKVVSLKRVVNSAPYVKVRKVPPEEEGAYKIKMPSGTTEKTRKILQNQKRLQLASKRSVFDRLGAESAVSSSTDSKNQPSVFIRLGSSNKGLHEDLPTSTVFSECEERKVVHSLPYKGVLKMTVGNKTATSKAQVMKRTVLNPVRPKSGNITKTISVNRINTILSSSTSPKLRSLGLKSNSGVLSDRFKISRTLGVKSRLGNNGGGQRFDKARLGKARSNITIHKVSTVFDRLGK